LRNLTLGTIVCLLAGGAASAQTPDAQVMAPIQKFVESFDKGDLAGAAATHSADADLSIVDEVAPFHWQGPRGFQEWSAALDADSKKRGVSDQMVKLGVPTRKEVTGDRAYVVVPAVYTFKEAGVAKRESAQMTFTLKKSAGAWLIQGWTWTGPKPSAQATGARR
jgi:hypothetical protein